jgi:hypothetical protein
VQQGLPAHLTNVIAAFTEWAYQKIDASCRDDAVASPVFHYTTEVGLRGILSTGAIRLTFLEKLDDEEEFLYGRGLARDALKDSYQQVKAESARCETISLYAQRCFCDGTLSMLDEVTPASGPFGFYSASFCRRGDDEFLWREYAAKGAGFALKLAPILFSDPPKGAQLGVMDKIFRMRMRYNRGEATTLMKEGVNKAVELVGAAVLPADSLMKTTFLHAMSVRLLDYVIRMAVPYKKPCFAPEREMRLLLLNDAKMLAPMSSIDAKGRRFVQYDFVPSLRSPDVLREVTIGPLAQAGSEGLVAQLLRDHGYPIGPDGKPLVIRRSNAKMGLPRKCEGR